MELQWPIDPLHQDLCKGNIPWKIRSSNCCVDEGSSPLDMMLDWYLVVYNVKDFHLHRATWNYEYVYLLHILIVYNHFQVRCSQNISSGWRHTFSFLTFSLEFMLYSGPQIFQKYRSTRKVMWSRFLTEDLQFGSGLWNWVVPGTLLSAWLLIHIFVYKVKDGHNYAANIRCQCMKCSQLGNQVLEVCAPQILFIARNMLKEWLKCLVRNPAFKAN